MKLHKRWIELTTESAVDAIVDNPSSQAIIFKHSTTCSISKVAFTRMEKGIDAMAAKADVYYLDLLKFRSISNYVATKFDVEHESPQAIVVKNGACVLDASHLDIYVGELLEQLD